MTTSELTNNERAALAREVAADNFHVGEDLIEYECEECDKCGHVEGVRMANIREAVQHGWDAAMEYVEKQRNSDCGFCWVCRTHHRLTANQCRAMDGVV